MILVTGATGYVGGRLAAALARAGRPVRCLARRPFAAPRDCEAVLGDVLDPDAVRRALGDVDVAYYLVHSMAAPDSFEEKDREAARVFGEAARECGVRRIIYLGGLGSGDGLSPHLRSRHEVGRVLRDSGVPVIEFRASVVIGSGSLSFEMVRALVERLPVMIAPRWVGVPSQPIAIADLIAYLTAALDLPPETGSRIFEIGGADRVSYGGLMREYARQRGLTRAIRSVPVLTPRLSSLWLALVTPVYMQVGRKLIDSIRHPTVVEDDSALRAFPIRPRGCAEAVQEALAEPGPMLRDSRTARVAVPPAQAFDPISRIGGRTGWYYGNWLWQLRGTLDRLLGGPGLRRGRPEPLRPGAPLDFWRVERYEPGRLLRLAAEMKLPGRAWLEFEVEPGGAGSLIRQTATFDARGVLGRAYWWGVYPVHALVFRGMLRGIARAALSSKRPSS